MTSYLIQQRPRRNRISASIRGLMQENDLHARDLIYPMFVIDGEKKEEPIISMPGISRYSKDLLLEKAREAHLLGIPAIALFPALANEFKDRYATESTNSNGLLQQTVRLLKEELPSLTVITDIAMDPYSSDGHDGLVKNGEILNDETLEILARMAIAQAEAGADIVAPSDMMDGRVAAIRAALDDHGYENVGILSYTAKYASAFYGPFRDALDSAPKSGDKKTYQMDPANVREAIREVLLDEEEGADMVMVKPGMPYLVRQVREVAHVPVAVYQVSGEYAMIKAASQNGWLDQERCMMESLLAFKRAGADMILTYFAVEAAKVMQNA